MAENFSLSNEQLEALGAVMDPSVGVAILTGPAGTGKSTLIRELSYKGEVSVCATTGKAAMNIPRAVTIDKLFGISRTDWRIFSHGYTDWSMQRAKQTILIDEASMIGEKMADLVYKTAVSYKKRIILVGDWGQAAPVKEGWAFASPMFTGAKIIRLTECHRQHAGEYLQQLNKVRVGEVDDDVTKLFTSVSGRPQPERNFPGICMFATNNKTDGYNAKCLNEHIAETGNWAITGHVEIRDKRSQEKQDKKLLTQSSILKMQEDSGLMHGDRISIGSKIVCTRNAPSESGESYVNGTIGYVEEMYYADGRVVSKAQQELDVDEDGVLVAVDIRSTSGQYHNVRRITLELCDTAGNVEYEAIGLPIKLGYGVTIHKSQGMTVDNAWFDMESLIHFPDGTRHGLAYVALSRTRTLEGLHLNEWVPRVVECDPIAKPWL